MGSRMFFRLRQHLPKVGVPLGHSVGACAFSGIALGSTILASHRNSFGIQCSSIRGQSIIECQGGAKSPNASDGLWHEATKKTRDDHTAQEVVTLLGDIKHWRGLIPFCLHSSFMKDCGDRSELYKVRFGMAYGRFVVGDVVHYKVKRDALSLHLVSVNGDDLTYTDHIEYTFSARDLTDGGCEVSVDLKLHARRGMYLRIWQTLESQLVDQIVIALKQRLQELDHDSDLSNLSLMGDNIAA